jgi:hypothetical protein
VEAEKHLMEVTRTEEAMMHKVIQEEEREAGIGVPG